MDKFGKEEDFIIEHLVFAGSKIEGYVSQGGSLLIMKGEFLTVGAQNPEPTESTSETNLMFKLEGINHETKIKYQLRGYFDKLDIKASFQDVPPKIIPRILQLEFKSESCTIFMEPGKKLFQGKAKETKNRLLVIFNEKGVVHILSAIKNKKNNFVAYHTRGVNQSAEVHVMMETVLPAKVRHKSNVYSFCEVNQNYGLIVEIASNNLNQDYLSKKSSNNLR